jgi:hypothetical protein
MKINKEIGNLSRQIETDPAIVQATQSLQDLYVGAGYIPQQAVAAAPNFGALVKGDVLARRSGIIVLWPWAMTYEHTGNYYGNTLVYESNSDGVRTKPLSNWKTKGSFVGLGRDKKVTSAKIASAVDWASKKYGTGGTTKYNYNFVDKQTDARLYCSQLTWKIHKNAGIDLDSNAWQYVLWVTARYGAAIGALVIPAVAPDEVMLSSNLNVYSTGWN